MSKICEFQHNSFKSDPGKFHFLLNPCEEEESKEPITSVCSKANHNHQALTTASKLMSSQKHSILKKWVILSQIS